MKIKEYQDAQNGHSSSFHGICFAFLQAPQPQKWRKLPQKNGKTSMPSSGQITETKSLFQHQKMILKMPKMVNKESDLKSSSQQPLPMQSNRMLKFRRFDNTSTENDSISEAPTVCFRLQGHL